MALSPTNDAALLQEVDEAVRKDRVDTIMQNYGRWIVGGVVAALLAFGGYLYWEHRQTVARGEKAEQLLAAFDKAAAQPTAATADLSDAEAEALFARVTADHVSAADAELFRAHMLTVMAGMSHEDGLVMQIHPGALRNHNPRLFAH